MKKNLKSLKSVVALAAAIIGLAFLVLPAQAQTTYLNYGYVSKRAGGAVTNTEVIFPQRDNAIIRLTSYDVTGDNAACVLRLQGGTYASTVVSNALSTATNVYLLGNSYIVAGDIVVFQKATGQPFSATVDLTNSTQLTFAAQLGVALTAGDKVYRMANLATNTVGNATVRKDGPGIFASQVSMPLRLFSYGSASATAINSATAAYGCTPDY
jgi:hypothetical protein